MNFFYKSFPVKYRYNFKFAMLTRTDAWGNADITNSQFYT